MRKTCAGCKHLKSKRMLNSLFFYCGETDAIVPQGSEFPDDDHMLKVTFWRVPMSCPLPDTEVIKSEDQAPQKDWVVELVDTKKGK